MEVWLRPRRPTARARRRLAGAEWAWLASVSGSRLTSGAWLATKMNERTIDRYEIDTNDKTAAWVRWVAGATEMRREWAGDGLGTGMAG